MNRTLKFYSIGIPVFGAAHYLFLFAFFAIAFAAGEGDGGHFPRIIEFISRLVVAVFGFPFFYLIGIPAFSEILRKFFDDNQVLFFTIGLNSIFWGSIYTSILYFIRKKTTEGRTRRCS